MNFSLFVGRNALALDNPWRTFNFFIRILAAGLAVSAYNLAILYAS